MRGYTGTIAGVAFEDGRPAEGQREPDRGTLQAILGYARRQGLVITDEGLSVPDDDEPAPDRRHRTETHVGTRLADATEFATGGPVPAGQAATVGEQGPELIATETNIAKVNEFLDRNAADIIADAPHLIDFDRSLAIELEEGGKNRKTVLRALRGDDS